MFKIEHNTGRLIEAVVATPLAASEVTDLVHRFRMHVLGVPGRVVLCGDVTGMQLLPSEWADQFTAMFTRDNAKVERSAFLVSQKRSAFGNQLERMVREANNPARRVFDSKLALETYLAPVLDDAERAAVRALLAGATL